MKPAHVVLDELHGTTGRFAPMVMKKSYEPDPKPVKPVKQPKKPDKKGKK